MDADRPALSAPAGGPGPAGRARRWPFLLAAAPAGAWITLFFAWPVAAILARGLAPGGSPDLGALWRTWTDGATVRVAAFTVAQAGLSTVLTLAVGLPAAGVLARYRFRGRRLVHAAVLVPFVLPTVVVGSAFAALLPPAGIAPVPGLPRVGTLPAILLAHVFFNVAVVVRVVGATWAHLDPRVEEVAAALGAGPLRRFRAVTLPVLAPALGAAAAITFLFCFTSFGVILILGGPQRATLETEIWRATAERLDLTTAAALSILQLAAVVAALALSGAARRRGDVRARLLPAGHALRPVRGRAARMWVGANLVVLALVLGTPLAVLVARSLGAPDRLTVAAWRALARPDPTGYLPDAPLTAALTSLRTAAVATALALVVGAGAAVALSRARGRLAAAFDQTLMLPLGVSAVTVGFGFLIALDRPPLALRDSPLIVPVAQATVALPFVIRTLVPLARAVDPRLRQVAAVLGAAPRRAWLEVDLPVLRRAAAVAAGFAFAISLGEFGATVFIVRPETTTLPVVVYRLLGRPGAIAYAQAMASATLLMACVALAAAAMERIGGGREGGEL